MQDRRDVDNRDAAHEGCGPEGCRTGTDAGQERLQDRKGCWTGGMRDRRDEEQVGFMTRGMRTGGMQYRRGAGQEGIQDRWDAGQERCRTGEMKNRTDL